ncbi:hypothetical protein SADUNF_Sadunf15G0047400 [Salix dunnii]|uniref:CCHC-type domain-containing protein n=1 Tax=Salix dunnii TaxID=1413687 RepID=A0A835JDZ3_9ROSI|nr:hypothetical protein SADUNF_Sadunf15G0047400 [Salix dunnii]
MQSSFQQCYKRGSDAYKYIYSLPMVPAEIESSVHRIGRTGRCDRTGNVTTFINKNQSETTLADLMHLSQEAKQSGDTFSTAGGVEGCAYCGGLSHRIHDCPELEHKRAQQLAITRTDYFGGGRDLMYLYGLSYFCSRVCDTDPSARLNGWDTTERLSSNSM